MQEPSSAGRLACAIFTGDRAVSQAVHHLVEAGFATESIQVLLDAPLDDEPGDDPELESENETGAAGADEAHEELADEELADNEIAVRVRTGVRRMLPIGALVGGVGGAGLVLYDSVANAPLIAQMIAGVTTGAFLGAMAGIVMGLGHWEHYVDFPSEELGESRMLVTVDLAAQGREAEARASLLNAGATGVDVCSGSEALTLLRAGRPTSRA